jgi:hypothetical protein
MMMMLLMTLLFAFCSEFYFSEANLRRDLFLRQRMDMDGYVYISVVMNFNRVRALTAGIPLLEIVQQLDASQSLQVLCKRLEIDALSSSSSSAVTAMNHTTMEIIDPAFVQLGKVRPKTDWLRWVPQNPLPSCHPFDLFLKKPQSHAKST